MIMIIGLSDGTGKLYHVTNLLGQTVLAYRNLEAAERSLEGDQRIFTQNPDGSWVEPQTVHPCIEAERDKQPLIFGMTWDQLQAKQQRRG